ncbi:MAG: hypothetical protein J1E40_06600 [Oscillospiraceae bacterium]|nr:hypothetical protein [Oscillospiraceae bacterium]
MEENSINEEIIEEEEQTEAPMTRKHYTKQQNILYTILSIGLFFILYFAVRGVMGAVNRPYYLLAYADTVSENAVGNAFEISGISKDQGYEFESARLDKDSRGYALKILFSGAEDEEIFSESGMTFEYGNVEEDIRTEFYPYEENPDYAEYVYADKYVNIDDPSGAVYLFNWEGELYIQYIEYSSSVSVQVSELFAGQERIYTDN